ncbi:hypothetical protein FGU65_01840 [Methanoculleus sp. FWC-SCC1]|uniref:Uncharacterized protein n=1 Tax=Methanoculleus frigidifontis TaxID=2584085 RepID=A0ABT8M6T9_9EURY|nr:hypothetical protein [Methanoculleus sp. FWC-SCC1]MDN7023651.1 hypothetical protein [Methanoculleus sp. FWC-SCC1]
MAPIGRWRGHSPSLLLTVALLLILPAVPHIVSGSTPPLNPELTLSVANDTLLPGESLEVSVLWSRTQSPYLPPEAIQVSLYSAPEKTIIGTYRILPDTDVQSDDPVRHFSGAIPSAELPGGELILTALDPISGTERHVAVYAERRGTESSDLRNGAVVRKGTGGIETMRNLGREIARLFWQVSA